MLACPGADQKKTYASWTFSPLAATDSRFLREVGIPALGVSYLKNTPLLLHDHDERMHEDIFLEGIDFYENLITQLSNVTAEQVEATRIK
jgi:aminoacylase